MPQFGPLEIVMVLVIALIVLGPKRLPEVGRSLGRGIREFKDSINLDGDDEPHVEQPPKPLAPHVEQPLVTPQAEQPLVTGAPAAPAPPPDKPEPTA
jgi:sec-independent protein translocase protein TatA